jgi:hypothetical protein
MTSSSAQVAVDPYNLSIFCDAKNVRADALVDKTGTALFTRFTVIVFDDVPCEFVTVIVKFIVVLNEIAVTLFRVSTGDCVPVHMLLTSASLFASPVATVHWYEITALLVCATSVNVESQYATWLFPVIVTDGPVGAAVVVGVVVDVGAIVLVGVWVVGAKVVVGDGVAVAVVDASITFLFLLFNPQDYC